MGLGLSTAKSLALALQGAISLETKVDKGTKVTFSALTFNEENLIEASQLAETVVYMEKCATICAEQKYLRSLGLKARNSSKSLLLKEIINEVSDDKSEEIEPSRKSSFASSRQRGSIKVRK